jgi:hypothetical protein
VYARGFADVATTFNFVKVGGSSTIFPNFSVGDTWNITITGAPNSPVYVGGSQNGVNFATYQIGSTDSSGKYSLSGTMGQANIGQWFEDWYVGGTVSGNTVYQGDLAGSVNFSVAAAPATTPPTTTPPTTTPPTTTPTTNTFLNPDLFNNLITSQGLDVGGYDIPWWAVAAGVGALFFLLSGRKR